MSNGQKLGYTTSLNAGFKPLSKGLKNHEHHKSLQLGPAAATINPRLILSGTKNSLNLLYGSEHQLGSAGYNSSSLYRKPRKDKENKNPNKQTQKNFVVSPIYVNNSIPNQQTRIYRSRSQDYKLSEIEERRKKIDQRNFEKTEAVYAGNMTSRKGNRDSSISRAHSVKFQDYNNFGNQSVSFNTELMRSQMDLDVERDLEINDLEKSLGTLTSGQFERLQRMKRERDFSVWQNSKKKTKVEMLPNKAEKTKVDKRRPMIKESMVMQESGSRVKERSLFKRFIKFMK